MITVWIIRQSPHAKRVHRWRPGHNMTLCGEPVGRLTWVPLEEQSYRGVHTTRGFGAASEKRMCGFCFAYRRGHG